MNKKLLFRLPTLILVFFISLSFSQTLELGTLQPFRIYAGSGAVTNVGTSAGNAGIISCFLPIECYSTNKRDFFLII